MATDFSPYVPKVVFEKIPIKNLVSNQEYQRRLSESQILRAVADFDLYQINPVKVSRRDGINYVFDGQHTIEIVAAKSMSRDTPVWCMIYDSLEYQHEAQIFAEQQKHSRALVPIETFILFGNQFSPDDMYDYYPADRLMHDIALALMAVQTQTTEVLDAFPTTPVTKEAEQLMEKETQKSTLA